MSKKPKNYVIPEHYDPEYVRDISEQVYRLRLEDPSGGGAGSVERMIANDKDGGVKLRSRAGAYDGTVRAMLAVMKIPKPRG